MRQRCALARTLMFDRDLVLLDEPLSALDAITRRELQTLLLMLQKEFGKTVLMITHDIEEALALADEIILLSASPMTILERFHPTASKPRDFSRTEFMETKARIISRLLTEKEKISAMKWSDTLIPLFITLGLLILWEVLVRSHARPGIYLLPPPSAIGLCAVTKAALIWPHALATGFRNCAGHCTRSFDVHSPGHIHVCPARH